MVQYSPQLDAAFAALSDRTRRGILERLGRGDASITDLASRFDMARRPPARLGEFLEQRKDIP
jgi:DNA-binding transcriptional ArsR family regulator